MQYEIQPIPESIGYQQQACTRVQLVTDTVNLFHGEIRASRNAGIGCHFSFFNFGPYRAQQSYGNGKAVTVQHEIYNPTTKSEWKKPEGLNHPPDVMHGREILVLPEMPHAGSG